MADRLFDSEFLGRLEYLRIVARRLFAGTSAGSRAGRRTGPGLEFSEHRAYVAGDDFRHIDWAAFGRLDRLLLRLCQQEEDLSIYFLLDASASMATGRPPKFDHARRLTAALGYVGLASLERVEILAVNSKGVCGHLAAGRGKSHLLSVLGFLRRLSPDGPTDLKRAVDAFLPHALKTGLAILVSDLFDPASPSLRRMLRRWDAAPERSPAGYERAFLALQANGFEPWCLHVTDRADLAPDGLGDLAVEDAETGETMGVCLGSEMRERLIAEARHFGEEVRAWCMDRGIGYAAAPTDLAVDTLVLDVLRRGGLVR
ncbi:MAG TPA: DUF58 domain-containing protein [Phycisphaerae bacterium]|nr:DUF58 domain-containing protein [Phycisphaerae bacterium]